INLVPRTARSCPAKSVPIAPTRAAPTQPRKKKTMDRKETLETAAALVHGDRQNDYGTPQENFARIAALWEPIFGRAVTPGEVALALAQLKIARLIHTPTHADSWVDAAGYIAIGAELETETEGP